jgi:hypothetical protein
LRALLVAIAAGGLVLTALGCSGGHAGEPEVTALPLDVRADYAVFALRCSKCHSLARPLNSGVEDDGYWKMYVERMRRQPGSGISVEDSLPILRFLHAYSLQERKKREQRMGVAPGDASSGDGDPVLSTGPR